MTKAEYEWIVQLFLEGTRMRVIVLATGYSETTIRNVLRDEAKIEPEPPAKKAS